MPLISVIMCNFDGSAYVSAAIRSALQQVGAGIDVEVIVIDDCSNDDSRAVIAQLAREDSRIRPLVTPRNLGPAGSRNLGLESARGEWIAIQDSDDLMHPERFSLLLAVAYETQADIVADDMLAFDDERRAHAYAMVNGYWSRSTVEISLETYIESNALYTRAPSLGYLKPIFRADIITNGTLRYREDLHNAEDFDFVLRLMAAGNRLMITPDLTYFYRRRSSSISHRLDPKDVTAMRHADHAFRAEFPDLAMPVCRALDRRMKNLDRTLSYETLVARLKARDLGGFTTVARNNPRSLWLLRLPVFVRLRRLWKRRERSDREVPDDGRNIAFVTRQRIVGPTNGSSMYALSILETLKQAGFRLHYVCPSPLVFGSWPMLRLGPRMRVFDTITVRGGWCFGNLIIATDPRIALRAAGRVVEKLAIRLRLLKAPILGPAAYAIAAPLVHVDRLFLATHAPKRADLIICDYAFLTPAIPFVLRPDARSLVIMHDLFSARGAQFANLGSTDSVATLDQRSEITLLGQADRIVAIQNDEGALVAEYLGAERVIVAPMAMEAVVEAQPGTGDGSVLFIGSNTAPNVDALDWFFAEVWPKVHAARPDAVFDVVGGVGDALTRPVPDGAIVHGLVESLSDNYRAADVVVSPLRVGSGLKIKLVEALAHGKPIVASTVTCQGVESEVAGAVIVADSPDATIRHIVALLNDPVMRANLALRALEVAVGQFGAARCYGGIVDYARANLDAIPKATDNKRD